MPTDSRRLPNAAFDDLVEDDFVVVVEDEEVVLVVDGVVSVDVVDVGDVDPIPVSPAAAGPAASAKNRMEVAASRRQPDVTALEYDKPTLSLSCAYGVSCRARAERVRATRRKRRDSPQEPLARLNQLVPPLHSDWADWTRLGVLAGSITVRQHRWPILRKSA
jgi:hypothetical protein